MELTSFDDFIMIQSRDWVAQDGSTSFPLESAYPGRLRGGPSTGIGGVFAVMYHIFQTEDKNVLFTAAYPDIILKRENRPGTIDEPTEKIPHIVTFKVIRVTPDPVRGSSLQGGRGEWKARVRDPHASSTDTEVLSTYGQRLACQVQFDCWSNTIFECELLSEYVQELIRKYTGLIMSLGATRVLFKERAEDTNIMFRIPRITLRYEIGIEKIYVMRVPRIEEIRTRIQV